MKNFYMIVTMARSFDSDHINKGQMHLVSSIVYIPKVTEDDFAYKLLRLELEVNLIVKRDPNFFESILNYNEVNGIKHFKFTYNYFKDCSELIFKSVFGEINISPLQI